MVFEAHLRQSVAHEAGQQSDAGASVDLREAHQAVERLARVFGQGAHHLLGRLAILHLVGGPLLLLPHLQVDGRGGDVLVLDADVGVRGALLVDGFDGFVLGRRDGGDDDRSALDMQRVEADGTLGRAILECGCVHHEDLLLALHATNMAVVAHANEQASATGVGEGRDRSRQLGRLLYLVFEVLLVVLAFFDELAQVLLVCHPLIP